MAHTLSASDLKGRRIRRPDLPAGGTRTRELYDMFMANKGVPIGFGKNQRDGAVFARLTDTYGLDIRSLGYRRWVLAGEWFGKVYVDYIAERLGAP